MTNPPRPQAPLGIETDLELTIGDTAVDVRSTGDRVFIEFPSLPGLVGAVREFPRTRLRETGALLVATDLTIEVRSRDRTVAAIGAGAGAGAVSRLLGTAPAQIRLGGILSAVGQEAAAGLRELRALLE